jgi:ribosomal protein S18 acetylase RimI-like enzyme
MSDNRISVRKAQPEDAPVAGRLMYLSGPEPAQIIFGGPEQNTIRVFTELFRIPDHIYSYSHICVAEREGQVAGLYLGFEQGEWLAAQKAMGRIGRHWFKIIRLRHLPGMILSIIAMARTFEPLQDDDYTIQMLAVLPEVRRQGVATRLMEHAAGEARSRGLKRLVLDVLVDNVGARRFYEAVGFEETKVIADPCFCRRFRVQGSIRMVKPV